MQVKAYNTHKIRVGESLLDIIDQYLPPLQERTIVAITSKIISLCEKNIIQKDPKIDKYELVCKNADAYLEEPSLNNKVFLTIKNNILIPCAGIDESNGENIYILYPENIQETAAKIWRFLRTKNNIKSLGILITDSNVTPLKRGVTGIGIGWCGFAPLYDYVGKEDLFGNKLQFTKINNLDALACAAVFMMGEGDEGTPLAVINGVKRIKFQSRPPTLKEQEEIFIPINEDLFAPLLNQVKWSWNKKL